MTSDDFASSDPSDPSPGSAPQASAPETVGPWKWIREGLRASVLLAPRVTASPSPWLLLVLVLVPSLLPFGLARLQIDGPADFHPLPMLNSLWMTAITLWIGWWALWSGAGTTRSARLGQWFALAAWAGLPSTLLMICLSVAYLRGWLPTLLTTAAGFWTVYGLLLAGWFVAILRLTSRYAVSRARLALVVPCFLAVLALGLWQGLQSAERVWQQDYSESAAQERPRLQLSQETFETQQAVWQRAVASIAPRRAGETNVYGLVFAPYASEDVFLRESTMVTHLLEDRFAAKGRVLQLVNHVTTTGQLPWATPLNLRRGLEALGKRMDHDNDVLVIYMTSHGASNFELAASHWPLSVPRLTPDELREALDAAGIRHRVIAISACFSGGWIEPLANDDSLVMTAADADHTSYGCGRLSELTFFGRAMFDEQLRKTHSFEEAFAAAVPVIREREIEAGKADGFSNPQIKVGEKIRPILARLAQDLAND
jgi:hypothetical protein